MKLATDVLLTVDLLRKPRVGAHAEAPEQLHVVAAAALAVARVGASAPHLLEDTAGPRSCSHTRAAIAIAVLYRVYRSN